MYLSEPSFIPSDLPALAACFHRMPNASVPGASAYGKIVQHREYHERYARIERTENVSPTTQCVGDTWVTCFPSGTYSAKTPYVDVDIIRRQNLQSEIPTTRHLEGSKVDFHLCVGRRVMNQVR